MPRPKKLGPDAVSFGEGWPLPMTADERAAAENALGAAIPGEAWMQVEKARAGFIVARRRAVGGVTFNEMKSRLEKRKSACTEFLNGLRPADEIDQLVWSRLHTPLNLPLRHVWSTLLNTDQQTEIGQPLAGPILTVTALLRRIEAEIDILASEENSWRDADRTAAEARDIAGTTGKFKYLDGFLAELANAARAAGVHPTASKSSNARNPRPSAFVAFAAIILATIPEAYRPALQSEGALAAQCAAALTRWKSA